MARITARDRQEEAEQLVGVGLGVRVSVIVGASVSPARRPAQHAPVATSRGVNKGSPGIGGYNHPIY